MIWFLVFVVVLVFTHELGHYVVAKRQGIYEGWGIFPYPHVRLSRHYLSRWDYLSGVWGSMFSFPLFLLLDAPWPLFFLFAISAAVMDIAILIFYNRIDDKGVITVRLLFGGDK
jgi:hypothetical protein